jgi:glutathione synthase/RimK-type ligase-like ATP-grasp enzyme
MTGKVLVISHIGDEHVSMVAAKTQLQFVIADPSLFIDELQRLSFYIDKDGNFSGMFQEHNLNDFKAFWYRKPKFLNNQNYPVVEGLRNHCQKNYMELFDTLCTAYREKFWVSNPNITDLAEIKMYQLRVANQVGFNICNTLVSNTAKDVVLFCQNKELVVSKTMTQTRIVIDGVKRSAPVSEIKTSDELIKDVLLKELGLKLNPYIFQDYVGGIVHRVTVVNNEVFAMKTIPLKPEFLYDSRVIMLSDEYSENLTSEIPDNIKSMCLEYLKHFNLRYGAFDLIETEAGDFVFLECNPNGQWGFVEVLTGQDLSGAFARMFESA